MISTIHAVPFRAAVAAVTVAIINGAKDNTTAAIEIDNDFEWLLIGN